MRERAKRSSEAENLNPMLCLTAHGSMAAGKMEENQRREHGILRASKSYKLKLLS